jgi:lipopolysaccharide biosynthesis glycosyltransferase
MRDTKWTRSSDQRAGHAAPGSVTQTDCALVVYGDSNPGIALGLAVTIYSTLVNLSTEFRPGLYIIDCGITAEARRRLARVTAKARADIELHWINFDLDVFEAISDCSAFPPVVYARLFAAELIPPTFRRVVSLDADLLVRRDISRLFQLDLRGSPLAAARDLAIGSVSAGDYQRPYFNSGLLVLETATYRQACVKERALDYAASESDLQFPDQDALNAVVDCWVELDSSWNFQMGQVRFDRSGSWTSQHEMARLYAEVKRGPVILHFNGGSKPWAPRQTGPGSLSWVMWLARTRWFSSTELVKWLSNWAARSLIFHFRLRLGTMRLELRTALRKRLRTRRT